GNRHPQEDLDITAVAWNSALAMPLVANSRGWISNESFRRWSPLTDPVIYSRAPWFHSTAVRDDELIDSYVEDGLLPGGLPVEVVRSPNWRARVAIEPQYLYRSRGESLDKARAAMAALAYQRLERSRFDHLVPPGYGFDVAYYRTYGEVSYGDNLAAFTEAEFRGPGFPLREDMLQWSRPILRAEFRYLQRQFTQ
ncbi:unnamed protein product, partial [Agarophyton chilense]